MSARMPTSHPTSNIPKLDASMSVFHSGKAFTSHAFQVPSFVSSSDDATPCMCNDNAFWIDCCEVIQELRLENITTICFQNNPGLLLTGCFVQFVRASIHSC